MTSLILEIEYLLGVAFASQGPDSALPDWPPQPDRVFSALVAAWGERGEDSKEAEALKWLERQCIPQIAAATATFRTAPISFVPPNDPQNGRSGDKTIMPAYRRRQPRRFPAARLDDPVVRFCWPQTEAEPGIFESLTKLAANVSYVGHSASITRCYFRQEELPPSLEWQSPQRRIYAGRFDELRRNYKRFQETAGRTGRPSPGAPVKATAKPALKQTCSIFDTDWLILEHHDGTMPDVRAAAIVAKTIRDALLSGYRLIGKGDAIPSLISGHNLDGSPTRDAHLAILPLSYVGAKYADGHLLGFALVPPRGSGLLQNGDFLRAMSELAPQTLNRTGEAGRVLRLYRGEEENFDLSLTPTFNASAHSLDSKIYTKPSQTFATVTPIVLDRHLKAKENQAREKELEEQIKNACKNIGLPEPQLVVPNKHSALRGAVSAMPSGKNPQWMRWRLPASLASRPVTHAVLKFSEEIEGPVVLGAGRFVGLGLCQPIDDIEQGEQGES